MKKEQNVEGLNVSPAIRKTDVIGSFYYRDFGFENIEFEQTEDETVLIRCNSPEDLVTFEITKKEAIEMALAVLKNCL